MSNNKDFKLKNAVEVGGPTKVTLGTVTSGDIDLSTGNYFAETLAANKTYTISNAGDVQSFQLEVTGGLQVDISAASWSGQTLDVSAIDTAPIAIFIKPDGTELYWSGNVTDTVYQYSMSTPYDLSTATSTGTKSVTTRPYGMTIGDSGTKLYIADNSANTVYRYTMSTAWDITSAGSSTQNFSVSSQSTNSRCIRFNPDGTKMYITDASNDNVFEYDLSTAWDITTASLSYTFDEGSLTSLEGMEFFNSGSNMILVFAGSDDKIVEYSLSTAYDLSTATATGIELSVADKTSTPYEIAFMDNEEKFILVDSTNDSLHQYKAGTDAAITWPSSIEWANGAAAPAAPAAGETDLYTFSTDDGGTTFTGIKTGSNFS